MNIPFETEEGEFVPMTEEQIITLLNELWNENQNFKEAFEKTVKDAFDRHMDSRIAEEVIDYIHDSFYHFLKEE